MAIYGNGLNWNADDRHCVAESSNLKSSIVGNIYDLIVRDGSDDPIAVDNGCAVKVGEYTGDGLQTRYATVADDDEKIALVLTPAVIKDAFTKQQEQAFNFYNKAGAVVKAYEVVEEDIFGVSKEFITPITPSGSTTPTPIAVGDFVTWDPDTLKYKVVASDPSATAGFVAKVHSIQVGTFYDLVRLFVIQNKDI